MKFTLLGLALLAGSASAQTYSFTGLSQEDVAIIGQGLDELPRKVTDRNGLYQRLQSQITAIAQAAAKSQADARQAEIDKAIADAVAKAQPENSQP